MGCTSTNLGFMNINGKRYIVPHWIEVDESVTYDNIMDYVPAESVEESRLPKMETFKVAGKSYVITVIDHKISCNCPGFTFHRKCKHVEAFKKEHKHV